MCKKTTTNENKREQRKHQQPNHICNKVILWIIMVKCVTMCECISPSSASQCFLQFRQVPIQMMTIVFLWHKTPKFYGPNNCLLIWIILVETSKRKTLRTLFFFIRLVAKDITWKKKTGRNLYYFCQYSLDVCWMSICSCQSIFKTVSSPQSAASSSSIKTSFALIKRLTCNSLARIRSKCN